MLNIDCPLLSAIASQLCLKERSKLFGQARPNVLRLHRISDLHYNHRITAKLVSLPDLQALSARAKTCFNRAKAASLLWEPPSVCSGHTLRNTAGSTGSTKFLPPNDSAMSTSQTLGDPAALMSPFYLLQGIRGQ